MTGLDESAWLGVFDEIGARVRKTVGPLFGTEAGRAELSQGAGGDRTVEVDRLAEATAIEVLSAHAKGGATFSLLSEEVGRVDFGADYPLVLLDPIDGSLNAKQGIPVYAVMASLLDGPLVADVRAGYVINLVSGERWTAIRGEGMRRDGIRVDPLPTQQPGHLELLGLESSPRSLALAGALVREAAKIRMLGSMAISLTQAAAGGFSLFCSPIEARVFDMTAGILMVKEAGGVISNLEGRPLDGLEVGFETRSTLLAAADPATHSLGLRLLGAGA